MGTDGRDRITGQAGNDTLVLGGGDDTAFGGRGDDLIKLGAGNDNAYGGSGDDRFELGTGQNNVVGGTGRDTAVAAGSIADYSFEFDPLKNPQKAFILHRFDDDGGVIERTFLRKVEVVEFTDYTLYLDGTNNAARISGPDMAILAENTSFVAQYTASDFDGDTTGFEITGGADAALFHITESGTLSFIAAPDFEAPIGGDNTYEVEVSALDDMGAGSSITVTVTVEDVDETPVLISEFQPNPSGSDPETTEVELSGAAGQAFSGVLISVEGDAGSSIGIVDRVAEVSGTFDADGLLVVDVPDFENPSFTLILLDSFAGAVGDDIDLDDDGTADATASFGAVLDAIGVSDNTGDLANLHGDDFGGVNFYSGDEPRLVFRDASRGELFAVNDPDGGEVIVTSDAMALSPSDFDSDPLAESFGTVNPSFAPAPPAPDPVRISEVFPNPTGSDPSTTQVELQGTPGASFSGVLVALESDPGGANPGDVNSFANLSGTFDANGLLVVDIPDLENPSFSLVLLDGFTGDTGTDIDTDDDGTPDDLSLFGTVLDAVGIADSTGDEATLYAAELGGTDLAFSGDEPRLVFRDGSSGLFYAVNDPDGGEVIDQDGRSLDPAAFSLDPLTSTMGAPNPTLSGTPPPVVISAPYSFDFETDFTTEGWTAISLDSDTANTWGPDSFSSNSFAAANGFGDAAPANDWLISPIFDISNLSTPIVSFSNTKGFEDDGLPDPELTFLYSTDYTGAGDPTTATWTAIAFTASDGGFAGALSGDLDLSAVGASTLSFAFQYQSSGTGGGSAAAWQVDDFELKDAPVVTPPSARTIAEVQGIGATSPFEGETVTVRGIVTGDFQNGDADALRDLNGFFIQMETGDGDTATSDGVFVFAGNVGTDVALGDAVEVTGLVSEFFGATQISAEAVTVSQAGKISDINTLAVAVELDAAPPDANNDPDLEAYEGMLVRFDETLTINEMFQFDEFGQLRLTAGDRPVQFTQENAPDVAGFAEHQAETFSDIIVYDDGRTERDPTVINPDADLNGDGIVTSADGFGMGGTVTGLTGVLGYSFGDYRVHSVEDGANVFIDAQTRDAAPPSLAAIDGTAPDLTVATLNVLNFFTTLDTGGAITGPGGGSPRGADSQAEYDRQLEKLLTTLDAMEADIFGLVELENEFRVDQNGDGLVAIEVIVDGLNALDGSSVWAAVDPGRDFVDSSDVISVGMIYRSDVVSVVGEAQILDDSALASLPGDYGTGPVFDGPSTNRAPLAATFAYDYPGGSEQFTVAVTHMKSKGGTGTGGDADLGDGAGNFNETRDEGTQALLDWLDGFADEDQLVLGDFNAYKAEAPIERMLANGYANLEDVFDPGTDTFVFDGQTGTLDYAFASSTLLADVTHAGAWNINSNEPDLYDYNLDDGRDPGIFDGSSPIRSSDHDPVLVGLSFGDDLLTG